MLDEQKSQTGRYLSGEVRIPVPNVRHKPAGRFLRLYGASLHNLQDLDLMIPLGMLTVVTGVSGSGKSTLVHDVLYKALAAQRVGGTVKEFCDRLGVDSHVPQALISAQPPTARPPPPPPPPVLHA